MPYTIKSGDTLSALALKNNTTVDALAKANNILDPNKIYSGANLNIPSLNVPKAPVQPNTPVVQPTAPVAPTTPTVGSIYANTSEYSPYNINQASKASSDFALSGLSDADKNAIKSNTLASMQAEIDAQNSLYANKLATAKVQGANRLGSTGALQAGRGGLGSSFGNASIDEANKGNNDVYNNIEAERVAKVNDLLSKSKTDSTALIAQATKSKQEGLDARVKYLSDSATRSDTNTNKAAQQLIALNHDPKDFTPDQLAQYVSDYQTSPDKLNAKYAELSKAQDEADAAQAHSNQRVLSEGQLLVDSQGNTVSQGAPKTFAPSKYNNLGGNTLGSVSGSRPQGSTLGSQTTTTDENGNVIVQGNYDALTATRWNNAANKALLTTRANQTFKNVLSASSYLDRIEAAKDHPGSVGNQELLDAFTQLNNGGNRVTVAQVHLITGYRSISDWMNVIGNKLTNGGSLSDEQTKQILDLSSEVYKKYQASYAPIYKEATQRLQAQGVPKPFWNIPSPDYLSRTVSAGVNNSSKSATPPVAPQGAEYDYQRDLTAAQSAIQQGADQTQVMQRFHAKYK